MDGFWGGFAMGFMTCLVLSVGALIWVAVVKYLRTGRTRDGHGATRDDVRR